MSVWFTGDEDLQLANLPSWLTWLMKSWGIIFLSYINYPVLRYCAVTSLILSYFASFSLGFRMCSVQLSPPPSNLPSLHFKAWLVFYIINLCYFPMINNVTWVALWALTICLYSCVSGIDHQKLELWVKSLACINAHLDIANLWFTEVMALFLVMIHIRMPISLVSPTESIVQFMNFYHYKKQWHFKAIIEQLHLPCWD